MPGNGANLIAIFFSALTGLLHYRLTSRHPIPLGILQQFISLELDYIFTPALVFAERPCQAEPRVTVKSGRKLENVPVRATVNRINLNSASLVIITN